ncbi:putative RNA recognition motif domain containing protein [Neospora caninum Liverpool]|uniref:Putative RNA recognition motif domain containing protein n=1 Tax=Neospora caninum (strain Liverpool) TaxID=572307 RepID=F0VK88_NEOCL|nr:putative RNA recognition motif domain containing protein [Neospora caninum Liverpool]CBZ54489.1 putative RNA recognition motif domain containing protein [Neospora caninum Liverpool]|eukprot:XP_003884519.1 putative RNA recognition motif domain containing protein [Neospora caninum Liverpool]
MGHINSGGKGCQPRPAESVAMFHETFSGQKRVLAEVHKYVTNATTQSLQALAMEGSVAGGVLSQFDGDLSRAELTRAISNELLRELPQRTRGSARNLEFVPPPPGFDAPNRRDAAPSPVYSYRPADQGSPVLINSRALSPADRSEASVQDASCRLAANAILQLLQSHSVAWKAGAPADNGRAEETDCWSVATHGSSGDSGTERLSQRVPHDFGKPRPHAAAQKCVKLSTARKTPSHAAQSAEGDLVERALAPGVKVFFGNVMPTTTEEEMYEIFRSFGECSGLVLLRDRRQRPRGAGFVTFKRKEDAEKAMKALDRKFCVEVEA